MCKQKNVEKRDTQTEQEQISALICFQFLKPYRAVAIFVLDV